MGIEKISMTRNGVMIEAGTTWKLEETREKSKKDKIWKVDVTERLKNSI